MPVNWGQKSLWGREDGELRRIGGSGAGNGESFQEEFREAKLT